jgi:hypothetical protein
MAIGPAMSGAAMPSWCWPPRSKSPSAARPREARIGERSSRAALDATVRRERRVLFDGVRAEIHPYDVTVESAERPEVYDCKWGARGINADVLNQLDDAREHAADEDVDLRAAIVVFDGRRTCELRLARATAKHDRTRLVALESLDELREAKN